MTIIRNLVEFLHENRHLIRFTFSRHESIDTIHAHTAPTSPRNTGIESNPGLQGPTRSMKISTPRPQKNLIVRLSSQNIENQRGRCGEERIADTSRGKFMQKYRRAASGEINLVGAQYP